MCITILAPLFTKGLVDPMIDLTGALFMVLVTTVIHGYFILITISHMGKQALEHSKEVVVILMLPLDSLGWSCVVGVQCGHEL